MYSQCLTLPRTQYILLLDITSMAVPGSDNLGVLSEGQAWAQEWEESSLPRAYTLLGSLIAGYTAARHQRGHRPPPGLETKADGEYQLVH